MLKETLASDSRGEMLCFSNYKDPFFDSLLMATVCSSPEIDHSESKIDHYVLIHPLLEKHPGRLCKLQFQKSLLAVRHSVVLYGQFSLRVGCVTLLSW